MSVRDIAQNDAPFFQQQEGEQTTLTTPESVTWSGPGIWHLGSAMETLEEHGEDRDTQATVLVQTSSVVATLGRGPQDGDVLRYQGALTPQLQNLDFRVSEARPDAGDMTELQCAGRVQQSRLAKSGTLEQSK
jgi:hypothetical protein